MILDNLELILVAGNFAFRRPLFEQLRNVLDEDLTSVNIERVFTRVQGRVCEEFESRGGVLAGNKVSPVSYSMLLQDFCLQ